MNPTNLGVGEDYLVGDELWGQIEPLLPGPRRHGPKVKITFRQVMGGILYVARTGCQWKALPRCFGSPSTVHERFERWRAEGVFERLWRAGVQLFDERVGLEWGWQAMDGAMTKAPLGGKSYGTEPDGPRQEGHQA